MRFAILYRLDGVEDALPCGVAIEREDGVEVVAPAEDGMPERLTAEFRLSGPDLAITTVGPGDPDYFGQCLMELSRPYALGKVWDTSAPVQADADSASPKTGRGSANVTQKPTPGTSRGGGLKDG